MFIFVVESEIEFSFVIAFRFGEGSKNFCFYLLLLVLKSFNRIYILYTNLMFLSSVSLAKSIDWAVNNCKNMLSPSNKPRNNT